MKMTQVLMAVVLVAGCKSAGSGSRTLDANDNTDVMNQKPWNGQCLSAGELGLSADVAQLYLDQAKAAEGNVALLLSSNLLISSDNFFSLTTDETANDSGFSHFKKGNIMAIACLDSQYSLRTYAKRMADSYKEVAGVKVYTGQDDYGGSDYFFCGPTKDISNNPGMKNTLRAPMIRSIGVAQDNGRCDGYSSDGLKG